jgi:hypothetical protein
MAVPLNLRDIQSGFFSAATFNANNELIEQALAKALNRTSNDEGNAMEVDFDMGLNNIFNLKAAVLSHQAVPLQQVTDILAASSSDITSLVQTEDRYVATGGETEITLQNIVYTPTTNSLFVFKNGEYQRAGFEYLETANNKIEFVVPLVLNDEVDIFGSRYDAQQYVELAITAANNAATSETNAETSAIDAAASAAAAQAAAGYKLDVNNQTGLTYTLLLTDAGDFIRMDNAAANKVIVPLESSVNFDVGTIILVRQTGAGSTEIEGQIGVTINSPFANTTISSQDFGVALIKVGSDEWDLVKAFGGADTAELAEFSTEFDQRLQDFYTELLSADPTFQVNFDSLNNNFTALENQVDTFETNVNNTVSTIQNSFNQIAADFAQIDTDFDGITTQFISIQNDFNTTQSEFSAIQSDFSTIQSDWVGIDQRFTDLETEVDQLNIGGGFDSVKEEKGYTNLPNGMIMQWGSLNVPAKGFVVESFYKPFPNACLSVQVSSGTHPRYLSDSRKRQQTVCIVENYDESTAKIWNMRAGDDTGGDLYTIKAYWFAIGY